MSGTRSSWADSSLFPVCDELPKTKFMSVRFFFPLSPWRPLLSPYQDIDRGLAPLVSLSKCTFFTSVTLRLTWSPSLTFLVRARSNAISSRVTSQYGLLHVKYIEGGGQTGEFAKILGPARGTSPTIPHPFAERSLCQMCWTSCRSSPSPYFFPYNRDGLLPMTATSPLDYLTLSEAIAFSFLIPVFQFFTFIFPLPTNPRGRSFRYLRFLITSRCSLSPAGPPDPRLPISLSSSLLLFSSMLGSKVRSFEFFSLSF